MRLRGGKRLACRVIALASGMRSLGKRLPSGNVWTVTTRNVKILCIISVVSTTYNTKNLHIPQDLNQLRATQPYEMKQIAEADLILLMWIHRLPQKSVFIHCKFPSNVETKTFCYISFWSHRCVPSPACEQPSMCFDFCFPSFFFVSFREGRPTSVTASSRHVPRLSATHRRATSASWQHLSRAPRRA